MDISDFLYATPELARKITEERQMAMRLIASGGGTLSEPQVKMAEILGEQVMTGTSAEPNITRDGKTVMLPIHGVISKRLNPLMAVFGMAQTSSELVEDAANKLRQMPEVENVVMSFNSDGGTAEGLESARRAVKSLAEEKNVIALADERMNSAAYYLGSAANAVLSTPTSTMGSVGVLMVLRDETEKNEKEGVKYEVIRTGEFKALGNPMEQITDETVKHFEERANRAHTMFVNAVADNRQISKDQAEQMADGKTYMGSDAVRAGFADGEIASRQELMSLLMSEVEDETEDTKAVAASAADVIAGLVANVNSKFEQLTERLEAAEAGTKKQRAEALVDAAIKEDRVAPAMRSKHVEAAMKVGVDAYTEILGSFGPRGTALSDSGTTLGAGEAPKTDGQIVKLTYAGGKVHKFDLSDKATVKTLKNSVKLKDRVIQAAREQDVALPDELSTN